MAVFFIVFFALYGALNYYIFIRGWQALEIYSHLRIPYLILFLIVSSSYLISRAVTEKFPPVVYDFLLWIGSLWFAYIIYFLLFIFLFDILRLINWQINFLPSLLYKNYLLTKFITFIIVLFISSIVIFLGYLNTRNIQINNYEISLKKGASNLNELNVVLVADFHMTPLNNGPLLTKITNKINSLNPDIILMPGDIVDDKVSILRERNIGSQFNSLKAKYGVFASAGNHEFISGIYESASYIREHQIKLLRDSSELIDNNFYVVGRDDRAKKNFTGKDRKSLEEIMLNIDRNYPIILLDHTPSNLDEAKNNGVDLQLSGHTHHGQIFPANLITNIVYEVSWGYLKKGNTQFYVTCGVGTWGPPVRIGSESEIVQLKIKFVD